MKKLLAIGLILVGIVYLMPLGLALSGVSDRGFFTQEDGEGLSNIPVFREEKGKNEAGESRPDAGGTNEAGTDEAAAAEESKAAAEEEANETAAAEPAEAAAKEPAAENRAEGSAVITVLVDGQTRTMDLEDYVVGVVAAEAPADFPEEALKAQAVAARSYAVYRQQGGENSAHPAAAVCDDYRHCAAYKEIAVQPANAQAGETDAYTAIRKAVQATAGELVTLDGAPIEAVFHSASAARTESAKDVWGVDVPYLASVVSPGGSACPRYEGTVTLTRTDFIEKAEAKWPSVVLSGEMDGWFRASKRSEAGGILTVQLGGVTVSGSAVREVFGLNSTNFTVTTDGDRISFHTIGYGHGVGLSQYGAKYMAEQGSDYREILTHYYRGTEVGEGHFSS